MSTVKTVTSVRPIPCRSPPQRTYRPQTSDNRIIPVTLTYRVGWFDKGRKHSPYLTTIHPLLLCSIMLQQLPKFYPSHSTVRVFKRIAWIIRSFRDHCTFLGNCPPTPPLSQHKQVLLGYGKMMAYGRSRLAVSQKRINSGAWHEVRKWEKRRKRGRGRGRGRGWGGNWPLTPYPTPSLFFLITSLRTVPVTISTLGTGYTNSHTCQLKTQE